MAKPAEYRAKARNLRDRAETMTHAESKRRFLELAQDYEALADRVESMQTVTARDFKKPK